MQISLRKFGQAEQNRGRSVCFFFDKQVPMERKGKFYRAIVRPTLIGGSECWAIKKNQEQGMQVTEMRMLHHINGASPENRIRNRIV